MVDIVAFSQFVKNTRKGLGISQVALSKQLGWDQSVMSRFENGHIKKIEISDITKISKALKIKTSSLFIEPYYLQNNISLFYGDAETVLLNLQDNSVDCVVTSPPYYGLRDYEIKNQLGLEKHPSEYIDRLVRVFRQVKRILKPSGSLWINIGDTYWSGKGQSQGVDKKQKHRRFIRPQDRTGSPPLCIPKQKLLIPHRLAIALQEDGWILRSDNVWYKPNPIPDPVMDRSSVSHEYIFHFVKQRKYYFNMKAVALPSNGDKQTKPPQSVWTVKIRQSSKKRHKAVFPEELVQLPIRATCPPNGIFLDPFCGSGTALAVALREYSDVKVYGVDLSKSALNEAKKNLVKIIHT